MDGNSFPLHTACGRGQVETARTLIQCGMATNSRDNNHLTPLMYAVRSNSLELVQLLIESGADQRILTMDNVSPLYLASASGFENIVQYLLENKPKETTGGNSTVQREPVNTRTKKGHIPLHAACEKGHLNVVKLLIRNGADADAKDNNKVTPLMFACVHGFVDVCEFLLVNGVQVNAKDRNNTTPLVCAVQANRLDLVRLLLQNGADHSILTNDNVSALYTAAGQGFQQDIVMCLIEHETHAGVTSGKWSSRHRLINARTKKGHTPLHAACDHGHLVTARVLILNGADVNARDKFRWTPLVFAVKANNVQLVQLLLQNGASDVMQHNVSPLHIACEFGHHEIAQALLVQGTDASSGADRQPLIKALLDAKLKNGYTPLHVACAKGHVNISHLLISRGASVHAMSYGLSGLTPLHVACGAGHSSIAQILIANNANVNATNTLQQTPLHLAAYFGHSEAVRTLLAHGANINQPDLFGLKAVSFAARNYFIPGRSQIQDDLLNEGGEFCEPVRILLSLLVALVIFVNLVWVFPYYSI